MIFAIFHFCPCASLEVVPDSDVFQQDYQKNNTKKERSSVQATQTCSIRKVQKGIYYSFKQPAVEKKKRQGCRG